MMPSNRIAIIGAGHVGATAAYAMMLRGLFSEIVLIDENEALARAEAADLSDANALARPTHIWCGTYSDAATARIAVITAGAAAQGSESRLSLGARSSEIVTACAGALCAAGFTGIIVVAANPVDLMTVAAYRSSKLQPQQVLGTGTLLDSSRLRQALAAHLNVASSAVEAVVLGEHGDSEVPVFSNVRIGGLALDSFTSSGPQANHTSIATAVREAGYNIIAGKGYTSFGIATAIVRICEAIIRDERAVLPVSTLLCDRPDFPGISMSMPCIVGAAGVERMLTPLLTPEEAAALTRSAATISAALSALKLPARQDPQK